MSEEFLLLNPGPVPVSRSVRDAMAAPMVSHRSSEFEAVYARAIAGLEYLFTHATPDGTSTAADGQPLILNGTATLGMEAAVANLVEPDDTVVSLVNGKFGRRFARIADRHCRVRRVDADWGTAFDLDTVAEAIDETSPALVTMVHNETSTGLLNPVGAVGDLTTDAGATFVVDGVTSIGGDEFRIDDWHVDVAITDAQKCLAAPPGISALYATDAAIDAFDGDRAPFYADLDWHVRKAADDQTPFTSAVPLVRALATAVEAIREEGMPDRIARHRRQAAAFRDGFRAMGLSAFPTPANGAEFSNTVTAMSLPDLVRREPDRFFEAVADRNVSISGGQAHLDGTIFRVSNMGELTTDQIRRGLRNVGEALAEVGHDADVDAGLEAGHAALER